jgi:hypothetical protein
MCPRFTFTYDSPEYEPTNGRYEEMEWQSIKYLDRQWQTGDGIQACHLHSVSHSLLMAQVVNDIESGYRLLKISPTLCKHILLTELKSAMHISSVRVAEWRDVLRLWRWPGILAAIGLDTAQRTLNITTQWGVRSVLNLTQQLWYRCLPVDMYTDMMFSKIKSKHGNTCAQVFATAEGWTRAYPMQKKLQAHEAPSLLLQWEGVPNMMVMNGSKEQILSFFCHKCQQAGSHVKQTEPHTPWSNAVEGAIQELKWGTGCKMVWSHAPKWLYWMTVLNDKSLYDLVLPMTYMVWMVTCHRLLLRMKPLTSLPLHYITGMNTISRG